MGIFFIKLTEGKTMQIYVLFNFILNGYLIIWFSVIYFETKGLNNPIPNLPLSRDRLSP